MKMIRKTGYSCVGELRLAPIDVGYDLRVHDEPIELPDEFESVGLDIDGETYLVTGTREEMIAVIRKAGYRISEEAKQ